MLTSASSPIAIMGDSHFSWLTPAAPAAIAVVRTPTISELIDRELPPLGRARFVRVKNKSDQIIDEAVAVRVSDTHMDLMVHGGPGVRDAVETALRERGLTSIDPHTAIDDPRWSQFATLAHPAAVRWLLAHPTGIPPFPAAYLSRQPVVLITGPANAGKSTLLNAWCGHQRALVSDIPGTTRDLVAAATVVHGWRLRLLDSAGLRSTDDALEHAGQSLAERARTYADAVIYLSSTADDVPGPQSGDIVVYGKADTRSSLPTQQLMWSCHGLAHANAAQLLEKIGEAVLNHLRLPRHNNLK